MSPVDYDSPLGYDDPSLDYDAAEGAPPATSGRPGYAVMDWPWQDIGVDLVLNGHSHVYERMVRNGVTRIICGLGGQSRRNFVTTLEFSESVDDQGFTIVDADGNPIMASDRGPLGFIGGDA